MIHVYKEYYIKPSSFSYQLLFKKGVDKKGNKLYHTEGYYSEISSAITAVIRREHLKIAEEDLELSEAISRFNAKSEEIRDSVRKAINENYNEPR